MKLLVTEGLPIYEQLAIEEALFRTSKEDICFINLGTPDAIVMGISGKPEELINFEKFNEHPLPLLRRFSGGGTVLVDQDTIFLSFIMEKTSLAFEAYPEKLGLWVEEILNPLFGSSFSFFENDFVLNDKKFGGNAQSISKTKALFHTSFLWDFSPKKMDVLLLPKIRPQYRKNRAHQDFLCTLCPLFDSKEAFLKSLLETLKSQFLIELVSLEWAEEHLLLPHRKALERVL